MKTEVVSHGLHAASSYPIVHSSFTLSIDTTPLSKKDSILEGDFYLEDSMYDDDEDQEGDEGVDKNAKEEGGENREQEKEQLTEGERSDEGTGEETSKGAGIKEDGHEDDCGDGKGETNSGKGKSKSSLTVPCLVLLKSIS